MQSDETYMRRALELAGKGGKDVLPNPMVGALIVRDGKILSQGYHAKYGGIHAEAAALQECGGKAEGATLYVTLEPCCHRGGKKHNPPCTDAIIRSGISRVVVARLILIAWFPATGCRSSGTTVFLLPQEFWKKNPHL